MDGGTEGEGLTCDQMSPAFCVRVLSRAGNDFSGVRVERARVTEM